VTTDLILCIWQDSFKGVDRASTQPESISSFAFSIISGQLPTVLFKRMLSRAYYNERSDGRVIFFRDSRSRIDKANIVTMTHALSQKWNFDWLHLTKEEFKKKIVESRINYIF